MDYYANYTQRLSLLTPREREIAELLAWGASKKEIPDLLIIHDGKGPISIHTVENITTSIYNKLRIQKVSELCTIYFCTRFNISMNLSPIKRRLFTIVCLLLLTPEIFLHSDMLRPQRFQQNTTRVTRVRRANCKTSKDNIYGIEC